MNPLTVKRNGYHKNKKKSTIYTPEPVAQFLFDILVQPLTETILHSGRAFSRPITIFDPAIGTGHLTDPWYDNKYLVAGCDIEDAGARCHYFDQWRFEDFKPAPTPDLVLCNPPFNGAPSKKLYPEVFLKRIFELFGVGVPVVLFVPMGLRLNQRKKSKRWRWLRDCGAEITSIVTLPLDIFPDVEFHAEILIFNVQGLNPHYFLPDTI